MSLKAFHIVFIALSLALALGFGAWCLKTNRTEADKGYLALGVTSFAVGGLLIVYGSWFLRKLRKWDRDVASKSPPP